MRRPRTRSKLPAGLIGGLLLLSPRVALSQDSATDDTALLLAAQSRRLNGLAVAPDGRQAIAVVHTAQTHWFDYLNGIWRRVLVRVDLEKGVNRPLTEPSEDAHAPVWRADGKGVVFFARQDDQTRLETIDLGTGRRRVLARLAGEARNPAGRQPTVRLTPDGRFALYSVHPSIPWWQDFYGRLTRGPADLGETPIFVSEENGLPELTVQGVSRTFFGQPEPQEVWAVPLDKGEPARIADDVPGGARLVAVDWDGTRGTLLLVDGPRLSALPVGVDAPDASDAATLAGPARKLRVVAGGAVALLTAGPERWQTVRLRLDGEGRPVHEVLAEGPAVGGELWTPALSAAGDQVVLTQFKGTHLEISVRALKTGEETVLTPADASGHWYAAFLAGDSEIVMAEATAVAPERLLRVRLDDGRRTDLGGWPGAPDLSDVTLPRVRDVSWTSDGVSIEGLLLLPDDGDRGRPYPMLLYLHGGPEWHASHDFHFLAGGGDGSGALHMARAGYAVLMPNFRGSLGYGDDFLKDLGNHRLFATPAADSLAGVDAMIDRGVADAERLGVYGLSFGGMLGAWITGRDSRFRAAVPAVATLDAVASDRRSGFAFHATNPLRTGPEDDRFDAWTHPEVYRELSPLETAYEVRTPTLLISTVGEQNDLLGHAAYMKALRLNQVPVAWAYYPGAMHNGSWSYDEQRDFIDRVRAWFDRWVLGSKDSS